MYHTQLNFILESNFLLEPPWVNPLEYAHDYVINFLIHFPPFFISILEFFVTGCGFENDKLQRDLTSRERENDKRHK